MIVFMTFFSFGNEEPGPSSIIQQTFIATLLYQVLREEVEVTEGEPATNAGLKEHNTGK